MGGFPVANNDNLTCENNSHRQRRNCPSFPKIACVVFGIVFAMSMYTIAIFNTYRVYLLQQEINALKRTFTGKVIACHNLLLFDDLGETAVADQDDMENDISSDSYYPKYDYLYEQNYDDNYNSSETYGVIKLAQDYTKQGFETFDRLKRNSDDNSKVYIEYRNKNGTQVRTPLTISYLESKDISLGESPVVSRKIRELEEENSDSEFVDVGEDSYRRRNYKPRNPEAFEGRIPKMGRIKPLPTAHFSGDTSKYIVGQHENYNGDSHLRHLQRTFVDWKASEWVSSAGMDSYYRFKEGKVTIKESGLYFVYAQIYYLDEHDVNGFRVYKNGETVLQCTLTIHSSERKLRGNTCYTAGVEYFEEGDKISLGDLRQGRYSLFETGKSFFGLIRIGDIRL